MALLWFWGWCYGIVMMVMAMMPLWWAAAVVLAVLIWCLCCCFGIDAVIVVLVMLLWRLAVLWHWCCSFGCYYCGNCTAVTLVLPVGHYAVAVLLVAAVWGSCCDVCAAAVLMQLLWYCGDSVGAAVIALLGLWGFLRFWGCCCSFGNTNLQHWHCVAVAVLAFVFQ